MITYEDMQNMSDEELDQLKQGAARAIAVRLVAFFLIKLVVGFALRRWARRLAS